MTGADELTGSIHRLQALTERLRKECPWDREQTPQSIVSHTIEEAYEVADAAMDGDDAKLRDELGDLLFQSFFLSLLLDERGAGNLADVAADVHEKLVRRHPHVFGDAELDTAGGVRQRWEAIKTSDEGREGIFHDVPSNLPALVHARKLQRRAASVGFDYPDVEGALGDFDEELGEVRDAQAGSKRTADGPADADVESELGDLLFAVVNVARKSGVDAELALRASSRRFQARVETAERLATADGADFASLPLDEQDSYFDRAKQAERQSG